MNKRSVKKVRPVKASRSVAARKTPARKASVRKRSARQPANQTQMPARLNSPISVITTVTVEQVVARTSALQTHKYSVGQTVFYTSSPVSRPGASGSYEVVRLLPSDGEDYQYRIKNAGEAFERVAKESQLELDR